MMCPATRTFRPSACAVLLTFGAFLVGAGTLRWRAFQLRTLVHARDVERLAADLPKLERDDTYVSSNRCQACHPSEYDSWHRTFHRTMTQVARPENVAGAFDGTTVLSDGLVYRVSRDGDQLWAEMPDPEQMMYTVEGGKRIDAHRYWVKRNGKTEPLDLRDIPRVRRRVVMTTGSHHYQTYWVTGDKKYGRLLQTLPLVYLIKDRRWIPREDAFMYPPNSTRMITQWNHHCIRCHSTGGVPGLVRETGQLNTTVGELGIACEACHGPGEQHVGRCRDPLRRYQLHLSGQSDPTIVNPAKLNHRAASQVCGQCHGVYITRDRYAMQYAYEGVLYRPGDNLHRTRYYIQHPRATATSERWEDLRRNPSFFRERWWDDGTVLAGGREFTAMSVSGCYTRGEISCLSCHSMHHSDPTDQLKPEMRTNRACTQCHRREEYTSEISRHTFHPPDSPGSDCMNCHMPYTTYALLGAIRNHQISAPRVDRSIRHGVPNACNLCHLDQTLGWAQDYMDQWYGHQPLPLTADQRSVSAALLWLTQGHAAQRAIAAWHVGWPPAQEASGVDWLAPFSAQLLSDPYAVVRYVAYRSLQRLPGYERFQYDFLAPKEQRKRHVDRVVGSWSQRPPTRPRTTGDHLLIDGDGQLMISRLRTLLDQRDDRPVIIKE